MPDNLDAEMTSTDIIRQLLIEEQDAIISYTERAEQVTDPLIREVLLDIAEEEKVHVGELTELLYRFDGQQEIAQQEGAEEVINMDEEIEKAWSEFKKSNQTSIEDKLDVLLAQNQEIQVDTARTADLIPAVMGNIAEGTEPQAEAMLEETEQVADDMTDTEGDEDPYAMLDELDGLDAEESADESDVEFEGEESDVIDEGDESDVADEGSEEPASDVEFEGTEEVSEEPAEEGPAEEESDAEVPVEEETDEDEERFEKMREAIPPTRTIKSFEAPMKKILVSKVDKPPLSVTMGQSNGHDAVVKAIDELLMSEPVDFGYGVDPEEVVRKDWEMLRLIKSGFGGL